MPRTAVLAFLSLLPLSACDFGCYELPYTPEPGQDVRLKEGAWSFNLDEVDFAGSCGPEDVEVEDLQLQGSIFYIQGQRLEIEIEGLLLTGEQDGRSIFADGSEWYDVDYAEDVEPQEDEEAPSQGSEDETDAGEACEDEDDFRCAQHPEEPELYVSIDGRIDSPADLLGAMVIEQSFPGSHCIIQARYIGQFRGQGGQAQPDASGTSTASEGEDTDAG